MIMQFPRFSLLAAVPLLTVMAPGYLTFAEGLFTPTTPLSMGVKVASGEFETGDGRTLHLQKASLTFDHPDLEEFRALEKKDGTLPDAPGDFQTDYVSKEFWPKTLRLTPYYDKTRTLILGNFFRTFQPASLVVTDESGAKAYQRDVDYVFQEDWGLIANKDGHLTGKIAAKAQAALQRLDLVQADGQGKLSVKKGEPVWVCPALPEPDPGSTAVAGVYIAPWPAARNPHFAVGAPELAGAAEYAISNYEILPIHQAAPVATLHLEAVAKTLARLRAGESVKIAFMGDSITLGAEATLWWNDQYSGAATTYRGRVIQGLRERFPKASITPIEAHKGGVTVAYGLEQMEAAVAEQKPDLVIAAFGANDADGEIGGPPRTSTEDFAQAHRILAERAHSWGGEILFVTAFTINPWLRNGAAQRLEGHIAAVKEVAAQEGAAVADVHAEFLNLNARGIPYWSQIHNWTNHPGNFGHQVYAETILRAFPVE